MSTRISTGDVRARTTIGGSRMMTAIWTKTWTKPQSEISGFSAINVLVVDDEQAATVRSHMEERTLLALSTLAPEARALYDIPIPDYANQLLESWKSLEIKSRNYAEYRFGWPMRALRRTDDQLVLWPQDGKPSMQVDHSGLNITNLVGSPEPLYLPATILPVGFIVDSIIASALWAIPIVLVAEMRRRKRLAMGRCPMCNYDLRGDHEHGCSECGWRR